jgi:REP element-mobilizing transposase RayT
MYLISRRCGQRELLLRPDDLTNRIFLYCLAVAAQRFNIGIIAVVMMSNHYHAVVYDPDGVIPRFLETFHAISARAINRRRKRRENLWSAEQPNINYLVETNDVIDKTVYTLTNPVTDHLVDKALNWPGVSSMAWLDGRTVTIERPDGFFLSNGPLPKRVALKLIAPPTYEGGMSEWAALVRDHVAQREKASADSRALTGARVLGRKKVLATSPHHRADTPEARGRLQPFIAAKNKQARVQAIGALKEFRRLYYKARDAFKNQLRNVLFPLGTFALACRYGVSVAPL